MLRLAFDFIITWRETRTRPNAYVLNTIYMNKRNAQTYNLKVFFTIYLSNIK